jgi:hypothetical protein
LVIRQTHPRLLEYAVCVVAAVMIPFWIVFLDRPLFCCMGRRPRLNVEGGVASQRLLVSRKFVPDEDGVSTVVFEALY